ncbi:MAG: hypothetical protein WDZ83_00825 [Rhizobiaceae bacterium]
MVVVGIGAIVIAVHLTGGTRTATLDDAEAAKRRFGADFADIAVRDVWLTADRHAAILALEDGRAGIVWALGDRFLTRIVGNGDATAKADADGPAVSLGFDDFTWRGGPFTFASAREAQAAAVVLNGGMAHADGVKVHG